MTPAPIRKAAALAVLCCALVRGLIPVGWRPAGGRDPDRLLRLVTCGVDYAIDSAQTLPNDEVRPGTPRPVRHHGEVTGGCPFALAIPALVIGIRISSSVVGLGGRRYARPLRAHRISRDRSRGPIRVRGPPSVIRAS